MQPWTLIALLVAVLVGAVAAQIVATELVAVADILAN